VLATEHDPPIICWYRDLVGIEMAPVPVVGFGINPKRTEPSGLSGDRDALTGGKKKMLLSIP